MPRFGTAALLFVKKNGKTYVAVSERRTTKPGRWKGTVSFGFSGGLKEGETPLATLKREMGEELPFIRTSHIKKIIDFIGIPAYISKPGTVLGDEQIPIQHEGEEIAGHGFLVELKPKAVKKFGIEFENDLQRALQKAKTNKPSSNSNELSFPTFIPASEAIRLTREHPERVMPHFVSLVTAFEAKFNREWQRKKN